MDDFVVSDFYFKDIAMLANVAVELCFTSHQAVTEKS